MVRIEDVATALAEAITNLPYSSIFRADLTGETDIEEYLEPLGYRWTDKRPEAGHNSLVYMIHVAGSEGGNCWGGEARRYVDTPEHRNFKILDDFLHDHFPDLTYRQFRKISGMTMQAEHVESEYYGNEKQYECFMINLNSLVDYLNQEGVEFEPPESGGLTP